MKSIKGNVQTGTGNKSMQPSKGSYVIINKATGNMHMSTNSKKTADEYKDHPRYEVHFKEDITDLVERVKELVEGKLQDIVALRKIGSQADLLVKGDKDNQLKKTKTSYNRMYKYPNGKPVKKSEKEIRQSAKKKAKYLGFRK